jgi:outer membrane protein assembly factor BamB
MKKLFHSVLNPTTPIVGCALFLVFAGSNHAAATLNWPQFRGPDASGVSEDPAPVSWNVETGENIRWQTPIPGLGHSCPIVWENRVYMTTAVRQGAKEDLKIGLYGEVGSYDEHEPQQWHLLCLDKVSGKVLWDKLKLESVPKSQRHTKSSHCNSTPATDGQRIVAIFGSEGMFCFDMEGKQLWRTDLGPMNAGWYVDTNTAWGFGSSPVLRDGKVIVQCDVISEQFLAAYDAKDGHQIWRTARKDVPTWSTPQIVSSPGRTQIIVNGWKQIGGYDFATGKELWTLNGGGDIPVPTPIVADQLVILTSGHGPNRPMRAVRLDAQGDITPPSVEATNQAIAWYQARKGSYSQTPILVGKLLFGNMDGILTCFDAQTGKIYYNERIGGGGQGFTSSPVAADGKIYYPGEEGDVFVIPAATEFSVLATNKLGGICLSSPAISEGIIFFRTTGKLVAVGFTKK